MLTIPLAAVPSQTLAVVLDGQSCNIAVYTLSTGLYFDIDLAGQPVKTAVSMLDGARLLQDAQYLGFVGDFVCVDTLGDTDPVYTGLGARYVLVYLEASDLVTYGTI